MPIDETQLAEELVAILTDLIALPSPYPPGDTTAICAYAADRMKRAGLKVENHSRTAQIDNVTARLGSGEPSSLTLREPQVAQARAQHPVVQTGQFGAHMSVSLVNDGPVTLLLDTGK